MQTQCPHCQTRFRVTETQLNIADGFVRCGVCSEVFNAIEVASRDDLQPSLLDEDLLLEPGSDTESAQTISIQVQDTHHENTTKADSEIELLARPINDHETSATEDAGKEILDIFDESSESLTYVVPDRFRDKDTAQSHSTIATLLWSVGILLLTASLLIEYVWFNRDQFNQVPELQAWIEKLCQQVECKNISIRAPSKIELVSRNVYPHPNQKNALMINVTMKNNADFAQPYPVMQIEFSDVRGGTVAARRFFPAEYLATGSLTADANQSAMLQPGTSSSITMEIQDPGKQAMTYEFDFL